MQEIIIGKNEAGQRFDKYLHKYFKEATGSFIYKMLRKKNIELNGKKATGNEKLNIGDSVKIFMADDTISKFRGVSLGNLENTDIDTSILSNRIIYEDDDILIVNKPANMLSQKASKEDISINEILIAYLMENGSLSSETLKTFKPSICNRLDRNTTGLITFGKTLKGIQDLSLGFKDRTFDKYYLAAVWGRVDKEALIEGHLVKDNKTNKVTISKSSHEESSYIKTSYVPLCTDNVLINRKSLDITLLKIKLITGKTHQIRAHLSSINHSLLGDDKYGITSRNKLLKDKYKIKWQLLHSYELKLSDDRILRAKPDKIYNDLFPTWK